VNHSKGSRVDTSCTQLCITFALFEFQMRVVGLEWAAVIGRGTKKAEKHWYDVFTPHTQRSDTGT